MTAKEASYATARYHTQTKQWGGHGYHFEVFLDGTICWTGDIDSARANVWGRNHEVVGAVLVGNLSLHLPTEAQLSSLRWLRLESGYIDPAWGTWPHFQVALPQSPTSCPGDTWGQWMEQL